MKCIVASFDPTCTEFKGKLSTDLEAVTDTPIRNKSGHQEVTSKKSITNKVHKFLIICCTAPCVKSVHKLRKKSELALCKSDHLLRFMKKTPSSPLSSSYTPCMLTPNLRMVTLNTCFEIIKSSSKCPYATRLETKAENKRLGVKFSTIFPHKCLELILIQSRRVFEFCCYGSY